MIRNLVAITGASSGIGETFARKLAPDYDLLLIARREDRLRKISLELKTQHGCEAQIMTADLTVPQQLEEVAKRLTEDQRLVMLINNAGFGTSGLFWENDFANQEKMHQLHVMATLRLTHAALGNLVSRDTGAIVNVASVAAFVRIAGSVSYGATKSWMTVFTEGLHMELAAAGSKVAVQALCPGFTYSEFHDTMGMDRSRLAGEGYWMTAEYVVDASLDGLRRRKLFVIPNWRYRLLTSLVSKLPTQVRLQIEDRIGRRRKRQIAKGAANSLPPASK